MDYTYLFSKQKELDSYIQENLSAKPEELFEKKCLALLVEVGELANETRCFKFWSKKGPSEKAVILEEYVDGLHFILSLGIDQRFTYQGMNPDKADAQSDTLAFLQLYQNIHAFRAAAAQETYEAMFDSFLQLGAQLGFTQEEIMQAYQTKNEVNHQRQDQGY